MPDPEEFTYPDADLSDAVRESEREILEAAFKPKGEDEAGDKDESPQDATDEPARDEQGRFAQASETPKVDDAPADPQQQPAAEGDKQEQQDGKAKDGETVPSWRLREIAEERRQAQAEVQQLRAELARLQVQRQQPQPQTEEQIDWVLDPQGFANKMRNEFSEMLRVEKLNNNLSIAHIRHGETFEKAYSSLLKEGQNGNAQLVQHLAAQGNPGEAIVNWFKQGEMLRETNGDLNAYKGKLRDELLKDPEFRKQVIEGIKAEANGGGQGQGQQSGVRNITRMPPSLSRATGSGANVNDPIDTDDSDRAVFDYAFK